MEADGTRARIRINDGDRVIFADRDRPLLFALMAERIYVPSACGGRASCGQCRVRVLSGAEGYNAEERVLLSAAEIDRGVHLSCQVRVQGDLQVEIPEERLRARSYRSRVASIRDVGPDMREIVLDLLEPRAMSFKAGQYVQFFLPGTERAPQPVYRAYSMASAPSCSGSLTLVFGRVPGGVCTTYAFEHLRVGEHVTVNGPFGEFFLRDSDHDIILVAGGSGIAPIRGILIDMADRGIRRAATFFFSARSARDLVYRDEMHALETRLPGLRFIPVLSHPLAGDRWEGEQGGIASALHRLLPGLARHEAYLCGSPGMIDASINALRAKGLADSRIFFDKFS